MFPNSSAAIRGATNQRVVCRQAKAALEQEEFERAEAERRRKFPPGYRGYRVSGLAFRHCRRRCGASTGPCWCSQTIKKPYPSNEVIHLEGTTYYRGWEDYPQVPRCCLCGPRTVGVPWLAPLSHGVAPRQVKESLQDPKGSDGLLVDWSSRWERLADGARSWRPCPNPNSPPSASSG